MQPHEFRRHPDGRVDFDFYRLRAAALRRRAMRDRAALNMAVRSTLMVVMALTVATAAVAGVTATARVPGGPMSATSSGLPQLR
jgi:hypothetical protein